VAQPAFALAAEGGHDRASVTANRIGKVRATSLDGPLGGSDIFGRIKVVVAGDVGRISAHQIRLHLEADRGVELIEIVPRDRVFGGMSRANTCFFVAVGRPVVVHALFPFGWRRRSLLSPT